MSYFHACAAYNISAYPCDEAYPCMLHIHERTHARPCAVATHISPACGDKRADTLILLSPPPPPPPPPTPGPAFSPRGASAVSLGSPPPRPPLPPGDTALFLRSDADSSDTGRGGGSGGVSFFQSIVTWPSSICSSSSVSSSSSYSSLSSPRYRVCAAPAPSASASSEHVTNVEKDVPREFRSGEREGAA
jgi:hypothetical protein